MLGLGDVYLGAPVGIGGAYLCVYGMEGPGGYQFVGRTLQMWNSYRATREFEPGTPWLLRFFDRIRFFPVSGGELMEIREAFPHGRYPPRIEPQKFALRQYHVFLKSIEAETASGSGASSKRSKPSASVGRRRLRSRYCGYSAGPC